jgi:predicted GIY-YIG superfamily endonuclease
MSAVDYHSEAWRARVEELVAEAPPLSETQRAEIRGLLGGKRVRHPDLLPARPPAPPRECALYRYFDADEVLLYVGITLDSVDRRRAHSRHSGWTRFRAREAVAYLATREDAEAAEKEAIQNELPLFNKVHAVAGADERRLRYLVEHEAWDMIKVSA